MSVSPENIFRLLGGFTLSAALKGAVDLQLFTAIAEGNVHIPAIAARCGASERGVRILCDYLTVAGLLSKSGDAYALAPDAEVFLDSRKPSYIGGVVGFLCHPFHQKAASDVATVVRTGTTLMDGHEHLEVENEVWVEFAKSMGAMMFPAAQFMAGQVDSPTRLLDIAAGHGMFGIQAAVRHAGVTVDALDWPGVLAVAEENAIRFGVADRWRQKPGNALEMDFGEGYDVVYMTNFLHHFDRRQCVELLKKCRAALRPGGQVLTLEFVPNPDRVTPPAQAAFSMTMLLNTPAGDAYTFAEYESMFLEAGFPENLCVDVPFSPQRLIKSR